MHSDGMDVLLLGAPLLLVLVVFMFRADEHIAASDKSRKPSDGRRKFSIAAEDGKDVLTDPDGKAYRKRGSKKE
ncbi:hypothetical protein [Occallatibacter riparius]|uniref:Uncharacterized protein n=1 Tax=Occallatibacter riparius TaxID=1002689 RepID=A0A9J7BPU0_9BACT|nr:hypothetical protein [Occallatibacter riparius]UWZ84795.1 hypothetical protein MOP44_02395 [Occallatibacter riparius]